MNPKYFKFEIKDIKELRFEAFLFKSIYYYIKIYSKCIF